MQFIRSLAVLPAILLISAFAPDKTANGNSTYATITKAFSAETGSINSNHLFTEWNLKNYNLPEKAFTQAVKGFEYLKQKNLICNNILSIVDFSKASSQKRLFIIDMNSGKMLFHTIVAHGQNSGLKYAAAFSNDADSHKSSLGFYITLQTYNGDNGYSLKLKGCEKGINDNAYDRAIVLHGAAYADDSFVSSHGYAGRSYGCPAVPATKSKKIIDTIKDGSCLFIYHPNKKYVTQSKILNK